MAIVYNMALLYKIGPTKYKSPTICVRHNYIWLMSHIVYDMALLYVIIFNMLRKRSWYVPPLTSSVFGSIVDTFLFFSIAFYATGVSWISLAFGDLAVKFFIALSMLIPFRLLLSSVRDISEKRIPKTR